MNTIGGLYNGFEMIRALLCNQDPDIIEKLKKEVKRLKETLALKEFRNINKEHENEHFS